MKYVISKDGKLEIHFEIEDTQIDLTKESASDRLKKAAKRFIAVHGKRKTRTR